MSLFEPTHCRLDAYTALRDQLPWLGSTDGLVRAAVAVSMHELSEADLVGVESTLDGLAEQVRERIVTNNPRALVAHTHEVLFEDARFRGNLGDYHDPANSYLPTVLKTRLGLPITLTLVYKAVLDRLGVPVHGINAPGHFLAAVPPTAVGSLAPTGDPAFIDPFNRGRLLDRREALDLIAKNAGGELLLDETANLLPTATHKQWLLRLIYNLRIGFERRGQDSDAQAMAEMIGLVEAEG